MKRIHYNLIITSIILLAGCEQMAGYAVQLTQEAPPVIDEPVIDDPVIDDPVIDDPVIDDPVIDDPVIDDPVIDDPVIDDPIDDPVIDDPDIPDYVDITDEICNSKTDDERCEGETMVYCGGAGIENWIRVECNKLNRKCITFNDDDKIVATCTDDMTESASCTAMTEGEKTSQCGYLDFDYTGREYFYFHYINICSAGNDGIYRWHIIDYDLCSDSCSPDEGCSLKPCTEPGKVLCTENNKTLVCTQFKNGYYYINKSGYCENP